MTNQDYQLELIHKIESINISDSIEFNWVMDKEISYEGLSFNHPKSIAVEEYTIKIVNRKINKE